MPIINSNPTSITNPNVGGTDPVSSGVVTGHGSTVTNRSANDVGIGGPFDVTQQKTARWSGFSGFPLGTINSLNLEFEWSINASISANSSTPGAIAQADITLLIEYTLNGGGAWSTAVSRALNVFVDDGTSDSDSLVEGPSTFSVALMTSQDVTQVQVRTSYIAHAAADAEPGASAQASATLTTTITDIRLEADITLSAGGAGGLLSSPMQTMM